MTKDTESKEIVPAQTSNADMVIKSYKSSSIFFDVERFEFSQRVAQVFASSTMVPEQFKNNVGNCIIVLNLADRMQVDPFMLMQNIYIIHSKPGIEAKLAIALVNNTGKFSPLQYKYNSNKTSCYAYATRTKTGELCEGVEVSVQMAKDEGWYGKSGSKWKTMPTLMLMYRSAMFFARAYCPEALLGMQSREELHDFIDMEATDKKNYKVIKEAVPDKSKTTSAKQTPHPPEKEEPVVIPTPPEFSALVKAEAGKDFIFVPTDEDGIAHDNLSAYIEMVVEKNPDSDSTPESMMLAIAEGGSFAGFWSGFMQGGWKQHFKGTLPVPQKETPPPPEDTGTGNVFDDTDWVSNRLKKGGLSTFFHKNKKDFDDADEESKTAFRDKWVRVYGDTEPFPKEILSEKEVGDGEANTADEIGIDYGAKLREAHEADEENLLEACRQVGYDNIVIPMGANSKKELYETYQKVIA